MNYIIITRYIVPITWPRSSSGFIFNGYSLLVSSYRVFIVLTYISGATIIN
jgi:hypothetical protein